MRIIAGQAGGRRIKSLKTDKVRPTLDRVKEAIFNMISQKNYQSRGLDLFAGFGNLGLESVSRGAEHVDFVEKNKRHVKIINENIETCKFSNRTCVYKDDVFNYLQRYNNIKYDLIFLDPPYGSNYINRVLELIEKKSILAEDGLIIAEHHKNDKIDNLNFLTLRDRNYGDTVIKIYKREDNNHEK